MPQMSTMKTSSPTMSTVPQIISTKDIQYAKDQLSWLLLAAKKCAHFANESQDPSVRQAIERIGQMHQRHYTQLLAHLNVQNGQSPTMQTTQSMQPMQTQSISSTAQPHYSSQQ